MALHRCNASPDPDASGWRQSSPPTRQPTPPVDGALTAARSETVSERLPPVTQGIPTPTPTATVTRVRRDNAPTTTSRESSQPNSRSNSAGQRSVRDRPASPEGGPVRMTLHDGHTDETLSSYAPSHATVLMPQRTRAVASLDRSSSPTASAKRNDQPFMAGGQMNSLRVARTDTQGIERPSGRSPLSLNATAPAQKSPVPLSPTSSAARPTPTATVGHRTAPAAVHRGLSSSGAAGYSSSDVLAAPAQDEQNSVALLTRRYENRAATNPLLARPQAASGLRGTGPLAHSPNPAVPVRSPTATAAAQSVAVAGTSRPTTATPAAGSGTSTSAGTARGPNISETPFSRNRVGTRDSHASSVSTNLNQPQQYFSAASLLAASARPSPLDDPEYPRQQPRPVSPNSAFARPARPASPSSRSSSRSRPAADL
jgi:hypothetical protein